MCFFAWTIITQVDKLFFMFWDLKILQPRSQGPFPSLFQHTEKGPGDYDGKGHWKGQPRADSLLCVFQGRLERPLVGRLALLLTGITVQFVVAPSPC